MNTQTTRALNDLGPEAVNEIKNFFKSEGGDSKHRADVALKALGRINGNESNRLKEIALALQACRVIGVRGEAMRPLLAELNPNFGNQLKAPDQAALPAGE